MSEGQKYGYFVNSPKTWLLVRPEHSSKALALFWHTGIQITTEGSPLLGAPLGMSTYTNHICARQVTNYLEVRATGAVHDCFLPTACVIRCLLSWKWTYLSRTTDGLEQHLQPIEDILRKGLLQSISGRSVSDVERDLVGLPARLGGLGLTNPASNASTAFQAALAITEPIVQHILSGSPPHSVDKVFAAQCVAMAEVRRQQASRLARSADGIRDRLPLRTQRAMSAAREKGASSWLTALPLAEHGFVLSKSDFKDALLLKYGRHPPRLPSQWVCVRDISVVTIVSPVLTATTWDSATMRCAISWVTFFVTPASTPASNRFSRA